MPSELAFRAQLVVKNQRRVYDYWRRCAGARRMPSRGDIDPVAIPDLLPAIAILDCSSQIDDVRYRLAGTRLREIFGMELTSQRVFDLDLGDRRDYWMTAYSKVIGEKTPMQGALKGPLAHRDHIILFWLRLPLSDDGQTVNKILSYDTGLPVSVAMTDEPHAMSS